VRELMHLGPNDPRPSRRPPKDETKKDEKKPRTSMKSWLPLQAEDRSCCAALAWIASAALLAQSQPSADARPRARLRLRGRLQPQPHWRPAPQLTGTWVNKYCVGCHSSRYPQPGNDPVNLESASLTTCCRTRRPGNACSVS
jgi:hypothetical protein